MKLVLFFLITCLPFVATAAKSIDIQTEGFEYKSGDSLILEGYLAKPKKISGKVPGIIIIHDWMGPSEFTQNKAKEMAQMGYVALAIDVYGKGVRPKNAEEAGRFATKYKADLPLFRARVKAGLDALIAQPNVDASKVLSMGFCFGGTGALELARSGAPVLATVSFHGGLWTSKSSDAKNIKGKILVMHGAIDPYVSPEEVQSFMQEMNDAKVDYQFISYSGAVHSFTNPKAGTDPSKGAAYNEVADKRSWMALQSFIKEVFMSL